MGFFQKEYIKETNALGFRNKRRNLDVADHQNGKTNILRDKVRDALVGGKRRSKNGKIYYEYRKNRTDLPHSTI